MGRWLQDLKFGTRFLAKHPGFTAVVVLTLGLGIGASTAIFSVVSRVLLEPLPYEDPERLVLIRHDVGAAGLMDLPMPPADVIDLREQVTVFEGVAATDRTFEHNLTGDGPPEVVRVARVTANFFDVLGAGAAHGRTFVEADGEPPPYAEALGEEIGFQANAVISHGLWQRRFGGEASAVGDEITIDDEPIRVVGVLPRDFRLHMPANAGMSTDIDVWLPTRFDFRAVPRNSPAANRRVIARMLPGVTLAEAQRQADAVSAWQRETFDYHRNGDIHISVTPMRAAIVGHVRPILIGLFVAVGIVLLIACANVANLLLVQAMSREREIAIRAAVGGGRNRIFGQLMTESLLLATIGGLAGLLVARWGIDLLLAARPANLPRLEAVPIDAGALAFTAGLTLLAALLFGSFPALQASRTDLHGSLNDRGGVDTSERRRRGLRGALVAGEVALAMVLLVGAGLMLRSLENLENTDLGFSPDSVLTYRVSLPVARYSTPQIRAAFFEKLEARTTALPGVKAVGATSVLPLGGQFWTSPYEIETAAGERVVREANYQFVTPGTFEALDVELVAGRLLSAEDQRKMKDVVVVDRRLAAITWPGESPIGRKLFAEGLGREAGWFQVVGVVESIQLDDPRAPSRETIFFPHASQGAWQSMHVVVRSDGGSPESLTGAVHGLVGELDAELPIGGVRPMSAYVDDATAPTRFATLLIGLFALVALVLAAIGVYGVVSSMVRQRTREIGLRLALGAPHPRIVRTVVGRGVRLGLVGLIAGLLASLALARLTASLVVGVSATDPLTYAAVGALLVGVTALASLLPARRAIRVNPMDALRYE